MQAFFIFLLPENESDKLTHLKVINNMFFKAKQSAPQKQTKSYYFSNSSTKANWSDSSYSSLSKNGYISNVIANRCINMISKSISSVAILVYEDGAEVTGSGVNRLLARPNQTLTWVDFVESVAKNLLISGNSYVSIVKNMLDEINELHILRPDRVAIATDKNGFPFQYIYSCGKASDTFDLDLIEGKHDIVHLKFFNPVDDLYGLSPMYTARFSIDQYNEAISWNKALLQNGARPSGALVVESDKSDLTDEQFERLKGQLQNDFIGSKAAGKIMILEGGLKWQEMSISPKDMDFIETKNSAARDIALAFGVPSNLLGIQGDNTYSNLSEARISFWEETVMPLLGKICDSLGGVISSHLDKNIQIKPDLDSISVLTEKRYKTWDSVNNANFLTLNEKREILGFQALENAKSAI